MSAVHGARTDHRRRRVHASTTPTRTRPNGSPWPGSWRTPATSAWCRSPSTSARRCSTSTSGRSASARPPGCRCRATSQGLLAPPSKWWGHERYTLAFGQGVAVTAVQMASVYATIANGGVRVQPSIVAGTTSADGRFVPAPPPHRAAGAQAQDRGRADRASSSRCPGSTPPWPSSHGARSPATPIAAKTGTAQVGPSCQCQYGSSYIGMAPASNPQLVVAVNVQNPKRGSYFGNAVAGPGVLSRDEIRAADAEDPAGWRPASRTSGSPRREQR